MFYTGERSINLFINVTFLFEMFEFLTTNPLKWLQKYILTHTMGILVIALRINPPPLSALELKLSGLIMESRVDIAGDNQNANVMIANYYYIINKCVQTLRTLLYYLLYHSSR